MRIEPDGEPKLLSERDRQLLDGMDLSVELLEEIYECAAPRVSLPCMIDQYRLHREIGRGSCGRVYQAVDTSLAHPVAVKLLADYANDLSEARKTVAVEHHNIVRVFAAGHHESVAYIVYEFVDGPRLDQYLATRTRKARIRVVRDLTRGVVATHAKGIVHGDIRPRNILMDGDRPKLADFGLDTMGATMQDDIADLYRLAGLSGTPPTTAARLERMLNNRLQFARRATIAATTMITLLIAGWMVSDLRSDARTASEEAAAAKIAQEASDDKLEAVGDLAESAIKHFATSDPKKFDRVMERVGAIRRAREQAARDGAEEALDQEQE